MSKEGGKVGSGRRNFLKVAGASAAAVVSGVALASGSEGGPALIDSNVALEIPGGGGPIRLAAGRAAQIVAAPRTALEERALTRLGKYLEAVLGRKPVVLERLNAVPAGAPAIILAHANEANVLKLEMPPDSAEGFALVTGRVEGREVVVLAGNSDLGLKRAVQRFIIKSRQSQGGLEFPPLNLSEKPWIPEREWTTCPWVPEYIIGVTTITNPVAEKRMNIWLYSRPQIADYVEMLDSFGFSGVQLMDTCFSWAIFGSRDAFHDRLKLYAQAARENGQGVSLWVWGAWFHQAGWFDPDVTYTPSPGFTAFNDPKVRRVFERYYDYYAELASYVDRLIGHFYDPGSLPTQGDVFNYMKLLADKFRAKNPSIKLAIDTDAPRPADYVKHLVDNGFGDYLVLENSTPLVYKPGQREALHELAKRIGLKLGIWGWMDTEYETDQLASMYVNPGVLKDLYQKVKAGTDAYPLSYWSEMEAHHLNNIYSMYVSGQLLWNPDRDPHEILSELTEAIWGPVNGSKVFKALRVIEDARSGPSFDTYWWTSAKYRLGTENPAEDRERAESALKDLADMKTDAGFVPKVPLPFAPPVFVELMTPHLKQIRAFAEFRIEYGEIEAAIKGGASKDELSARIAKAWKPIPEYNTWVGVFEQIERRMQEIMLRKAAATAGIKLTPPNWLRDEGAERLLQAIQVNQSQQRGEWRFKIQDVQGFYWGPPFKDNVERGIETLISHGSIEKVGEGTYRLVGWENFAPNA